MVVIALTHLVVFYVFNSFKTAANFYTIGNYVLNTERLRFIAVERCKDQILSLLLVRKDNSEWVA